MVTNPDLDSFLGGLIAQIESSERPFVLLGRGAAGLGKPDLDFLSALGIPIGVTWSGASLASRVRNYVGVVGQFGRPTANRAFHLSDVALVLGSRLPTTVTGHNRDMLRGKIFHVDLDSAELDIAQVRLQTSGVAATVRQVIDGLRGVAGHPFMTQAINYIPWLGALQDEFLAEQVALRDSLLIPSSDGCASIVSHAAIANLFMGVRCNDHLVIDGGGTALYSAFQAAPLDKFRNVVSLNAISSMGTAPGQMSGVLNSTTDGRVIGVIGDGSFAMALNALPRIALNPRAVLVVLSNQGYLAIRHTQERFLGSRFDGTWHSDDEDLPSVEKIARALGMNYVRHSTDCNGIEETLASLDHAPEAASVIEIETDPAQPPFWSVSTKLSLGGKLIPNPLSVMTFMGRQDD